MKELKAFPILVALAFKSFRFGISFLYLHSINDNFNRNEVMRTLQNPAWLETGRGLLRDLLSSGDHSDVILVTEDQRTVRAHQVILTRASPSLRSILLEHSQPSPVITVAGKISSI